MSTTVAFYNLLVIYSALMPGCQEEHCTRFDPVSMRNLMRGPATSSRVVAAEARAGLASKEHVPACAVLRRRVAWRVTMPRHSLAHDWLSCVRIDPGGALMPVAPSRLCRHA